MSADRLKEAIDRLIDMFTDDELADVLGGTDEQ